MNLESIIPGLAAARVRENFDRAIVFAGLEHRVFGIDVLPLTPLHRLRLQLMRNAFAFEGVTPLEGDIFVFIWLLHPEWTPRRTFHAWRIQRRIRAIVKRIDRAGKTAEAGEKVRAWIKSQTKDMPEDGIEGPSGADHSGSIHWFAFESTFYLHVFGGFTLESYGRTPYLALQQLRRAWRVYNPERTGNKDGSVTVHEPSFDNASDKIVKAWHRERRAAVAAVFQNQRERRP